MCPEGKYNNLNFNSRVSQYFTANYFFVYFNQICDILLTQSSLDFLKSIISNLTLL